MKTELETYKTKKIEGYEQRYIMAKEKTTNLWEECVDLERELKEFVNIYTNKYINAYSTFYTTKITNLQRSLDAYIAVFGISVSLLVGMKAQTWIIILLFVIEVPYLVYNYFHINNAIKETESKLNEIIDKYSTQDQEVYKKYSDCKLDVISKKRELNLDEIDSLISDIKKVKEELGK